MSLTPSQRFSAPLLIIRPEPGNAATAAAARALGLTVHAAPLFAMAATHWDAPDRAAYTALLAGSANSFRLGGPQLAGLAGLPVHAVGEATAQAARAAGFAVARIGEGGLQPMVLDLPPGRYLRLAGEKHLPLALPEHVIVDDIVVYAARPVPMPESLAAALRQPAVIALHSGEAAVHFAAEIGRLGITACDHALACLAPRIAKMAGIGWQHIEIAHERTDEAVLALARQMCQKLWLPGN
ncbi:uroporphyrinogen-III synthase [Novosphingobium sp. Chol11]|uniref:uroporphyrinogen-III synthase n=1 Tax=Novosphingobium sp. Chol11 TaxID=1385763 RepID=UPI0025ED2FFE|nr:uroporphyrinogen-III synthase [Novosphingobium sp. Chol11]